MIGQGTSTAKVDMIGQGTSTAKNDMIGHGTSTAKTDMIVKACQVEQSSARNLNVNFCHGCPSNGNFARLGLELHP